jgi:DNA-binding MarR family transcriptional regulator
MNYLLGLCYGSWVDKLLLVDRHAEQQPGGHTRQQLARNFVDLIDQLSFRVRPDLFEAWSEIELTMHQFRALALLRQGPRKISEIAELLSIRLSAATSFVDRMETKRLVQRFHDPDDRRVVRCRLTALGKKEADSLWRINRQQVEHLSGLLTEEELETVVHALGVLVSAAEREARIQEAQSNSS